MRADLISHPLFVALVTYANFLISVPRYIPIIPRARTTNDTIKNYFIGITYRPHFLQ